MRKRCKGVSYHKDKVLRELGMGKIVREEKEKDVYDKDKVVIVKELGKGQSCKEVSVWTKLQRS